MEHIRREEVRVNRLETVSLNRSVCEEVWCGFLSGSFESSC
jgi:hypothetical protein